MDEVGARGEPCGNDFVVLLNNCRLVKPSGTESHAIYSRLTHFDHRPQLKYYVFLKKYISSFMCFSFRVTGVSELATGRGEKFTSNITEQAYKYHTGQLSMMSLKVGSEIDRFLVGIRVVVESQGITLRNHQCQALPLFSSHRHEAMKPHVC